MTNSKWLNLVENKGLNLQDNWMKNISGERHFLVTLFFAAEKRVTGSKGFESKTRKDAGARQGIDLRGEVR